MKKLVLFNLFALLVLVCEIKANHVSGANITYEHIAGDSFRIQLRVYQSCSNNARPIREKINICNTCGISDTLSLVLQKTPFNYYGDSIVPNFKTGGIERTQLCESQLSQSSCRKGGNFGFEVYFYSGIYVFTQKCNAWHISFSSECCVAVNNNVISNGLVALATMNSLTDSTNSSAIFMDKRVLTVCAGQDVEEALGVFDVDGDSLHFAFAEGYSTYQCTSGQRNIYRSPYTFSEPFLGARINSGNGKLRFRPTVTGNFYLVVEVKEYDRAGNLNGTNLMQILVVVRSCVNQAPYEYERINRFTGNAWEIDSNEFEMCIGETVNLEFRFADLDTADSLSVVTNILSALPGAQVNYQLLGDTARVELIWPIKGIEKGIRHVRIEVSDNACPVPGITKLFLIFHIADGADAGPDINICRGTQVAELKAFGGTSYTWTALPGGSPITIGQNFSCDTCKIVVANPRHTTTYVMQNNAWIGCRNKDTVTVFVNKNFNLSSSPDDTICMIDTVVLRVTPSDALVQYSYRWSPKKYFSNDSVAQTQAFGFINSERLKVLVRSDSNCIKEAHIDLTVPDVFPYNSSISSSNDFVCRSDTLDLALQWGEDLRPSCQSTTYSCQGNDTIFNQGIQFISYNGITSLSEPIPYAGFVSSARHQFLVLASELRAMGMEKGEITSIGFFNDSLGNASPFFHNYSISLACTDLNNMTPKFVDTGLVQVFDSKTIRVDSGFTLHQFDRAYLWDGSSNLIVNVCFSNLNQSTARSQNVRSQIIGTNYAASVLAYSFRENACFLTSSSIANTLAVIPRMRFGQCIGWKKDNFNFSWSSEGLGSPNFLSGTNEDSAKVFVNPGSSRIYRLVLSDTNGLCFDTLRYQVGHFSRYDVKPIADTNICVSEGLVNLKAPTPWDVLPRPNGGFWTGPGVRTSGPGSFDPALAGVGSHWLVYEIKGDSCANRDSSLFKVKAAPNPSFTEGPFCILDSINVLDTNPIHKKAFFVVDYGNGLIDTSNFIKSQLISTVPSLLPVTYYAIDACISDTTIPVQIDAAFNADITGPEVVCLHDDTVRYLNSDSGGTWTINGNVSDARFLARALGVGDHVIRIDSSTYCGATDSLVVRVPLPLNVDIVDPGPYYSSALGWNSTQLIGATPLGGDWSSAGSPPWMPLKELASFIPSAVVASNGFGKYPLYYTIHDTLLHPMFKVCSYTDTLDVIFCEGTRGLASISADGNRMLTANPQGSTYRWYRNDTLLNFTGRSISANTHGLYKVVVVNGICPSDSSMSLYVPPLGLKSATGARFVQIFPNPTQSKVNLRSQETIKQVRLIDIRGKELQIIHDVRSSCQLNLDHLPAGLYFLEIQFNDALEVFKLEKY